MNLSKLTEPLEDLEPEEPLETPEQKRERIEKLERDKEAFFAKGGTVTQCPRQAFTEGRKRAKGIEYSKNRPEWAQY